jgi:hypothetical protein
LEHYDGRTNLDFWISILKLYAPEQVMIRDGDSSCSPAVGQLIRALAQNPRLQKLGLLDLTFPASSLEHLLLHQSNTTTTTTTAMDDDDTHTLRKLSLQSCFVAEQSLSDHHTDNNDWQLRIRDAFLQNQTLQWLHLRYTDVSYMAPILSEMGNHSSLLKLELCGSARLQIHEAVPEETTRTIQTLLQQRDKSSRPLCIKFLLGHFHGESFRLLADAAIHCSTNWTLALHSCSMDATATKLFRSMFQSHSQLRSLALGHVTLTPQTTDQVLRQTILGPHSPLQRLLLTYSHTKGSLVAAAMDALKINTALEMLVIETIQGAVLTNLIHSLPCISHLKVLKCDRLIVHSQTEMSLLMQAFQKNTSLHQFVWMHGSFSESEQQTLDTIFARNAQLPQLLETPNMVSLSMWPNVLAVIAGQIGPEKRPHMAWNGLRALVDSLQQLEPEQQPASLSSMPPHHKRSRSSESPPSSPIPKCKHHQRNRLEK